ncbi:MAG: TRASH domain-containing protein [Bdellovibrionales bacterium]|nr:TRASH domain-containing protein [Bdellovibrionales bacterium]
MGRQSIPEIGGFALCQRKFERCRSVASEIPLDSGKNRILYFCCHSCRPHLREKTLRLELKVPEKLN